VSEAARPPLSVLVPTHDTRELTLACLAAVLRQEVPAIEVLVVDDGSSDGTAAAIALLHPTVRVLRNEHPAGFTRSANRGLREARGDLLLLLNSDTEVDPGGLAALLAAFAADPRLGAAGGALRYPDGRPQWSGGAAPSLLWLFGLTSGLPAFLGRLPLYRHLRPPSGTGRRSWLRRAPRTGDWRRGAPEGAGPQEPTEPGPVEWVTGAALGLRRAALASPAPFDESFRFYGQDLDLCLRLAAAGWRVAVVPGFGVMHHHGATISTRAASGQRGEPSPGGFQHAELLWTDLLYWAEKRHGAPWAARAARAMRLGAALRLAGRKLAGLLKPARERAAFAAESAALRRARRAIRRIRPPALANLPPLV
jgi:N-acetylglucosaminyl-diphospho-decaprenol L-rhamnosyltransferase